jgi:HAD superfamily hydrolase (TIGR01509 family)
MSTSPTSSIPASTTSPAAVLFDVDGTLVDSNYLHVHAWQRAFLRLGFDIEAWRIHRSIGMDGSHLVTSLAGNPPQQAVDHLKELHAQFYGQTVGLLQALPGATALLDTVADLGLQVVLATSAPEDELSTLRKVLGCDDIVSAVTSSADVEAAKPQPDIVEVAMQRAGVTADRAVFVGDTIWDIRAARRAGVACLCVLSGGIARGELNAEGAAAVFDHPAQLLEDIHTTPIAALTATAAR